MPVSDVDAPVVDVLHPGGEQPVHLGQVADFPSRPAVPGRDLDGELAVHGPEEPLDLAPALRPARGRVDQLDAQPGAGPHQPRVNERRAVIDVDVGRDAAGGQCRAQRGGQPDGVLGEPPPVSHDRPAVVVDEGEQVGLPAADPRAVECVSCPDFVGLARFEPAEDRRLGRGPQRGQPGADEHPLQGPLVRRPPVLGLQDPLDLRRGPVRVLLLQRGRQLQDLRRGPRLGLPRDRDQRVEPALAPVLDPPVQRPPGEPDRPPLRVRVRDRRDRPHHRPALPPRQRRGRRPPGSACSGTGRSPGPVPAAPPGHHLSCSRADLLSRSRRKRTTREDSQVSMPRRVRGNSCWSR